MIRRSLFLLIATFLTFANSHAFNVTFRVNMQNVVVGFSTPEVNGTFNGWCGGCNPMTDADGDDIWEITIPLEAGSHEYKFAYDAWSGQEQLTPGSECTATNSGYTNRVLNVDADVTLPVVCWASCANCIEIVSSSVMFQVDMSNQTVSPNGVHLAGSFADANNDGTIDNPYPNWNPGGIALANVGNGIWAVTLDLVPGSYEYKFVNGNAWDISEFFSWDTNCQNILNGNRFVMVESIDTVLPIVCWNQCIACGLGCMDPVACNYDPNATVEGTCIFPEVIPEIIVEPFGGNCFNNGFVLYPSSGNFIQTSWGGSPQNLFSYEDTLLGWWSSETGLYFVGIEPSGCVVTVGPVFTTGTEIPNVSICMVTVSEETGKNLIIWDPVFSSAIDSIVVYKESNVFGVYDIIGAVDFSADGIFEDPNSNSQIQSNRYAIGMKDSCGFISASIAALNHKTIHLTANQGVGNNVNLIWSPYEANTVEGPMQISSYNIYRGASASTLNLIATVAGNVLSYTDIAPPATEFLYVVEVAGLGCDPSREMMYSRSNVMNLLASNISEELNSTLQIFPNPASTQITFQVNESDLGASIVIYNALGQEVLVDRLNAVNQTLNIEKLSEGFYFLKVEGRVVRLQIVK